MRHRPREPTPEPESDLESWAVEFRPEPKLNKYPGRRGLEERAARVQERNEQPDFQSQKWLKQVSEEDLREITWFYHPEIILISHFNWVDITFLIWFDIEMVSKQYLHILDIESISSVLIGIGIDAIPKQYRHTFDIISIPNLPTRGRVRWIVGWLCCDIVVCSIFFGDLVA